MHGRPSTTAKALGKCATAAFPVLLLRICAEPKQLPTTLCSQSTLDSTPPSCLKCIERFNGIIPGGAACCNANNLAQCPRSWD